MASETLGLLAYPVLMAADVLLYRYASAGVAVVLCLITVLSFGTTGFFGMDHPFICFVCVCMCL